MNAPLLERVLDLACAIQQIPAPTFHERPRAEFIRDHFTALGLCDIGIDEVGNVLARRPGGDARPILVTAHTDTVFPADTRLDLTRSLDRIAGPGIGDNSLGVAALCGLMWSFGGEQLPGDVWLAANVGEEGLGDLRGMRRVVERLGELVAATIVLEGLSLGHIHHAGIGVRRYRLTARTAGGHSYLDFGQPSAIHVLVRLAARIADLVVSHAPKTTFNIGVIGGGTSVNTIAREASLDLDLRSEDPAVLAPLAARVEELAASFGGSGAQVETRIIGDRPAGSIPREHPLVQLAVQAHAAAGAEVTSFDAGSTDANLPLSLGRPCVCVGLTTGGNAHRPDEYIETANVEKGMHMLNALVRGAFGLM